MVIKGILRWWVSLLAYAIKLLNHQGQRYCLNDTADPFYYGQIRTCKQ